MLAIFFITAGVFLRLTPHIPNFAPISAIAIFGGTYFNKRFALLVPLFIMIVSDFLLSPKAMFHSTTIYVWGSFMISGLIGLWLKKRKKPIFIFGASLFASLQFFFITNFGVWATTNMYPHNLAGLIQSYIMGIPFYRNTLLGDLFYTVTFFSLYELSSFSFTKLVKNISWSNFKQAHHN